MHNKKCKKVLAAVLAGAMVLGMGTTAFAADPAGSGSLDGTGDFEGYVDKDVISVALPTSPATTTFAYTMDPQGLIAETEGAKDTEAEFTSTTGVYFLTEGKKYTENSAKLKVINKGTVDADVTVTATTEENDNVNMATSKTFTGTAADLYLGLLVANQPEVAVQATGGTDASVTVGVKGRPANYEIKYDESKTPSYEYVPKTGLADAAWNSFEFGLTGACNKDGDFSAAGLTAPKVTVTWSYAERDNENSNAAMLDENASEDAAPSVTTTTANLASGQPLEIGVNLGAGSKKATGIANITFANGSGTTNTVADSKYTYADGKITFISDWVTAQITAIGSGNTRTYTVTFDDSAATTGTFTVTAP